MNGQVGRQHMVRELVRLYKPDLVVETGTYRGSTTHFLWALTGALTISIESSLRNYLFARRRLAGLSGIQLLRGDSAIELENLGARPYSTSRRPLFYLDAHWEQHLPLCDELRAIRGIWKEYVIIIDDFEVPHDSGYLFDDYGHGKRLALDYLPDDIITTCAVRFPKLPSSEESGARRGCAAIFSSDAIAQLAESQGLVRP